jgi:hypothetical protein
MKSEAQPLPAPASLTLLEAVSVEPGEPAPAPVKMQAMIQQIEGRRMEISTPQKIRIGTAVKIESPQAIWLGEVQSCAEEGRSLTCRIDLRHVLRDFETLARLAERFGQTSKETIPVGT